jgi:hypothetical protein
MRIRYFIPSPFRTASALLLAAALGAATAASKSAAPADSAAIVPPGKHAHMDCMADSAEMAQVRQAVQDALKSGDKGKMKSALETVDAHFAKQQIRMEQCKQGMKKGEGAMMEHDGDMMCGKDHEDAAPSKGAHPEGGGHTQHHKK